MSVAAEWKRASIPLNNFKADQCRHYSLVGESQRFALCWPCQELPERVATDWTHDNRLQTNAASVGIQWCLHGRPFIICSVPHDCVFLVRKEKACPQDLSQHGRNFTRVHSVLRPTWLQSICDMLQNARGAGGQAQSVPKHKQRVQLLFTASRCHWWPSNVK